MSAGESPTTAPVILPPPPTVLACNILTIPAGTTFYRIHDSRFDATEFNPGLGASRFAPIESGGSPVPTSYGATSFSCAVFETIFHDIEPGAAFKSVSMLTIRALSTSTVEIRRQLRLAKLFSADLLRWNLARSQIIDTPRSTYPQTRLWSAAIHDSDPSIDGMIWASRKYDEERAVILFGTRVTRSDLAGLATVRITSDAAALAHLHALAKASDILLTL